MTNLPQEITLDLIKELRNNGKSYEARVLMQTWRDNLEKNKEQVKREYKNSRNRIWQHKNKDKLSECKKSYYQRNKEKILKYQKEYREKNPEKMKEINRKSYLKRKVYKQVNSKFTLCIK